ncbi:MAG: phenylalanine--tRNA ligase subunit alpha [Verrucomicrobiae bacterium]|nr:phenylalanine--tRNA ligase subunit alpha [Verrucomicrobiae bacterium]
MPSLEEQFIALKSQAPVDFSGAVDEESMEAVRVKYVGRKGLLPELMKQLGVVPAADKPKMGRLANEAKQAIQAAFDQRKAEIEHAGAESAAGLFDATLPGRRRRIGRLHPLTLTMERVVEIFRKIGFTVAEGPEIEDDWHCFDALNTPADHPARDLQDTLYLKNGKLLRTQTSTVQIRIMEKFRPPIRIVAPGRVFRRDEVDATHSACFSQIEGLYVAENVSVADLKGTVDFFFKELLGPGVRTRFRPHFFPYTEPSFEIDFSAESLGIKGKEWLEIAGCGMVDPNVFKAVGYDAEKYTGFAFGFGIERIAMILHGIDDIRLFYQNDPRFLEQFC